jgi:hypothetical protein
VRAPVGQPFRYDRLDQEESAMSRHLSRWTVLALALACVLAAGCRDKERPKPVTQTDAAGQQR